MFILAHFTGNAVNVVLIEFQAGTKQTLNSKIKALSKRSDLSMESPKKTVPNPAFNTP
ncbi:hypothetical protein RO3G_16409 [Rhizopus delemar RA 99-880]|uniref:Uncharacterized protein n=1 Tax=Rhizopus delemar (strain RA 99-880 / ATCC MYA-4621 / FGSC 9543 / NRRL 43880) TaxID=246409 RepID=I1CTB8_RHIO9|nr:hypothetical protein RO3G_16409 [Rhizopus delemar RA 99-880]|eukprot:EIE91698.1 hypothetical protein RO3G_16409 [Rhizopus delemar RA 99-880]